MQKQAKIKQNSRENQTKLTLLNPKKNNQFLQNSTKKSNKINTVKPKEKQTIFLLKMGTKIFWKFYCAAYTYLPIPMKIFKMKFFFKLFFFTSSKKKLKKIVFLARVGFKKNEGGRYWGAPSPPVHARRVFCGEDNWTYNRFFSESFFQTKMCFSKFCKKYSPLQ